MTSFDTLKLLPSLRETLREKGWNTLTDIQGRALPALLEGRSIVGIAETGSGKTLAYALPILHRIKTLENEEGGVEESGQPRAAVIVPTRELGDQVTRVFKPFTHTTRLRVRAALGGTDMDVVKRNVSGAFDILVATPGQLIKLLDRKLVKLGEVQMLVFDEADQMLDAGFLPSATRIAGDCARGRQMALFSATVPPRVQELIERLFTSAEFMRSEGSHQTVRGLKTRNVAISDGERFPALEKLLAETTPGGTMIFTNTREQCDKLAHEMKKAGYASAIYRGEMDKIERRKNLQLFREGKIGFLISTDLASRGLDVEHVGRVINYHLPQQIENYLHRVGRTARAGRTGTVVNFVTERDERIMKKVEGLSAKQPASEWPDEPAHKPKKTLPSPALGKRGQFSIQVKKRS